MVAWTSSSAMLPPGITAPPWNRNLAAGNGPSFRVLPDYIVVGASKAALEALTRYLAVELAPMGIRVNAVSPGIVETDALRHFDLTRDGDVLAQAAAATPAGRLVTPQDVAGVVAFLCSEEAWMIRGQILLVDGGFNLPAQPIPGAGRPPSS